jgi:hypothetical protein
MKTTTIQQAEEEIYRSKVNYLTLFYSSVLILLVYLRKIHGLFSTTTSILIFIALLLVNAWITLTYTRITKTQIEYINVFNYALFKRKSITLLSRIFLVEVLSVDTNFNYIQQMKIYLKEEDFIKKRERKAITIPYSSATEIESFIKYAVEQKIPVKISIDKRHWKDRERLTPYHTYNDNSILNP